MTTAQWTARKQRACHITLRDIDIPGFDVGALIDRLQRCHISAATLFAGGYVCTYPTKLNWQRMRPGLDGRDLFGEILEASRHKDHPLHRHRRSSRRSRTDPT